MASYRQSILVLFLGNLFCWSHAENILMLSPIGPRSHINSFMPMIEKLAEKGHQITVITAHQPKTSSENVNCIVLSELLEEAEPEWYKFRYSNFLTNSLNTINRFKISQSAAYEKFIKNKNIQELIHSHNANSVNVYDLIIVDAILHEFTLPLVDHLKAPFVFYNPGPGFMWNLAYTDVSKEYAYFPPLHGDYKSEMKIYQRMINMIVSEVVMVVRKFVLLQAIDELARKEFPNSRPVALIERDAQLCLANIHSSTYYPRPLPPTYIPISAMHVRPPQPLPKDFQDFANEADEGFIVFTLGSNSRVSSMPEKTKDMFVRVFSRLPQRVFWKWENVDLLSSVSANVKLVDWMPQQDLLGHKNAKILLCHGGLMGLQEAIYHAIPILGFPLGRDQRFLLGKGEDDGIAIKFEWEDLTEPLLFDAIKTLLQESSYKENVMKLSQLMKDELVPAKDVAVYWIEHVLRHGGTKHLQSKAKDMPFYQLYMLDVWALLVASFILTIYATYRVVSCIKNRCLSRKIKVKTQ